MKSILITGGSGFLGNAIVEHLLKTNEYDRICIYSRDEAKHAAMRDRFQSDKLRFFIGCVRDKERLERAMAGVDVVIHAAALKRIETCHYNPDQAIRTNIDGAINVIEACASQKVKSAVLVSTDKAFQPVSIYGQTKAVAESLFLSANNIFGESGPTYSVVRYGNVWGSTGSVVPKWKELLKNDCEINVTNLNATRFYMTSGEAVEFVMSAIGKQKLLIPESLPAYSIKDLVSAFMKAGYQVTYTISGMPEHEKLHESMAENLCSEYAYRMSVEELAELL